MYAQNDKQRTADNTENSNDEFLHSMSNSDLAKKLRAMMPNVES